MSGRSALVNRLREQVTIRRAVIADDGHGGQIKTWTNHVTVWAEVISQNGREAVLAGALQGVSVVRITIRWRADLLTTDQIQRSGVDHNIRSVADPNGRREALVIFADTASVET